MADGVVFLPSFYEAIKDLPDNVRLGVYDAVASYGLYGEMIEMEPTVKCLFTLIKPNIDASQRRYRTAKANGSKGGRPKKNQSENQLENQIQNQDIDSDSDSEKDIDSDNDSESDSDCESEKEREGLEGGGNHAFPPPYKPPSETDFENMRQQALAKLGL